MSRSILAVVAGAIVMVVGVLAANLVLVPHILAANVPGDAARHGTALAGLLLFDLLVGVAGGYVTARIVSRAPQRQTLVPGTSQVALLVASALVDHGAVSFWWHVGLLVFLVPAVDLGGWLRVARLTSPASANV